MADQKIPVYNKERFVDNVYALAKRNHLQIGKLESSCGVSTGYLARLRKGSNNISPGAEFLLTVASFLSVQVDALLTLDLSHAATVELELLEYLTKLIRDTESCSLRWQEDYFSYPEALPVNQDGTTPHPLYRSVYDAEGNPRGIIHYYSVFHPLQGNLLPQKTYGCIFPGNRTLYLVRVVNAGRFPEDPEEWTELELVMTGAGIYDPIPLAHTDHKKTSRLDRPLQLLFDAAEDSASLPMMTPEARTIISDFLKERKQGE